MKKKRADIHASSFSVYIPDDVIGGRGIAYTPLVRVHDRSNAGLLRFPTATCPPVVLHNATQIQQVSLTSYQIFFLQGMSVRILTELSCVTDEQATAISLYYDQSVIEVHVVLTLQSSSRL